MRANQLAYTSSPTSARRRSLTRVQPSRSMLVIWVSLFDWRTKRDTSTRSGTNAGTNGGGGAVRRGPGPRRERRRGAGANVNTAGVPHHPREGCNEIENRNAWGRLPHSRTHVPTLAAFVPPGLFPPLARAARSFPPLQS